MWVLFVRPTWELLVVLYYSAEIVPSILSPFSVEWIGYKG
jgi:hypothetical protein